MVKIEDMPDDEPAISKPGWQTTEFWLSLAAVLVSFAISQHIVPDDTIWAKLLGILAAALTALGYSVSRSMVKREQLRGAYRIREMRVAKLLEKGE